MPETPSPYSLEHKRTPDLPSEALVIPDSLESKLITDYHLTREEIRVIAEAYKLRRKELFLATRKELQDFINQDYRAANEEALGGKKGVEILQEALKITPDGKFGPSTFRTLIDFQKNNGLRPDGVAGPRTIAVLNIAEKIKGTDKIPAEPAPVPEVVAPIVPSKPSASKIISTFENRAKAIKNNFQELRAARDENTGLVNVLIDDARSVFGGETGKATYEKAWESIRAETRASLAELKASIGNLEMSEEEQARLSRLDRSYARMLKQELGGPEVIASTIASIKAVPDAVISAGFGIIGTGK